MRPELLNPLFAEISVLKGVGNALSKPLDRLGLSKMVDLAFHLPIGWVERMRVSRLDHNDIGRTIIITLTPTDYRAGGSPRAPFRVWAVDGEGNGVSLVYFGKNSGWPRKLLPIGEPRVISGKLEAYGDQLQIIHPNHVGLVEEAAQIPVMEPVYPLSEGITNARMRDLAAEALTRAPELPEWIDASVLGSHGWKGWRDSLLSVHATPDSHEARRRLAYDEIFSGQLALMLVRAASR